MKIKSYLIDAIFMLLILIASFSVVIFAQKSFETGAIAQMIFVMAVFLVSLSTHGYIFGITASL